MSRKSGLTLTTELVKYDMGDGTVVTADGRQTWKYDGKEIEPEEAHLRKQVESTRQSEAYWFMKMMRAQRIAERAERRLDEYLAKKET